MTVKVSRRAPDGNAQPRPDHLRAVPSADPDIELTLTNALPAPLPATDYLGTLVKVRRGTPFKRPALELVFEIVADVAGNPVPEGTRVSLWLALGTNGRVRPSSKFARTWELVAGRRAHWKQPMTTGIFRGKMLRLRLRTVTTDHQQRELPLLLRYSIVDAVVGVETGGGHR